MPIPEDVAKLLNDDVVEVSHEFEIDLTCLVTTNYRLTMEAIERAERDAIEAAREFLKGETDPDTIFSTMAAEENFYADLRVAARNMAIVSLVTRVQHWIGLYARRLDRGRKPKSLDVDLKFLNSRLGAAPTATEYFLELSEVRHSVIHTDSQPNWTYNGKPRGVDQRYVPEGYRVEVSEKDLQDAIQKSVTQIKWYDDRLIALHK